MPDLIVSAPGKVILFGDHSVVYNRQAIAAAISLRTSLSFSRHTHQSLILDFPDIDLHLSVSHDELHQLHTFSTQSQDGYPLPEMDQALFKQIDLALEARKLEGVKKAAAAAFLYLYAQLGSIQEETTWGTYHITSDLPIGAGLGSSASVSVIISAALLLTLGIIVNPADEVSSDSTNEALKLINKWAYVGEQCIHGTPSGVDNTVATYGGAVAFQKTAPMKLLSVPTLPLLLTNTGVPRSTKTQVANVALLRTSYPTIVEPILDAMHHVALEAESLLSTSELDKTRLGSLISLNQGLLRTIGVSHPAIEKVVTENLPHGWSKLIGAGGGGCVITLLNSTSSEDASTAGLDMEQYRVELGGPGVGVHQDSKINHWHVKHST